MVRWETGYGETDQISKYMVDKRSQVSHCGERANKYRKKDKWNEP